MKLLAPAIGMLLLAAAPVVSGGPPLEEATLFSTDSPEAWTPSESGITSGADSGSSVLEWVVNVDHYAGESDYPIGWPRIVAEVPNELQNWAAWDYIRFRIRTTSNRTSLSSEPAGLILFDTSGDRILTRPLTELRLNEWVSFQLLTADLPKAEAVGRMQFYIAERNYRHSDRVHFAIDRISLSRHTAPALVSVQPAAATVFSDISEFAVQVRLSGLKGPEASNVVCEIQKDGRAVASVQRSVSTGPSKILLPLPQGLPAGTCILRTHVTGSENVWESSLRVIASPWRQP